MQDLATPSDSSVRLSRELEIMRLVSRGYTSKEAAQKLFLSKRTVDFHLAKIYGKLGVNNRVLAIRAAVSKGFLPFDRTAGYIA